MLTLFQQFTHAQLHALFSVLVLIDNVEFEEYFSFNIIINIFRLFAKPTQLESGRYKSQMCLLLNKC